MREYLEGAGEVESIEVGMEVVEDFEGLGHCHSAIILEENGMEIDNQKRAEEMQEGEERYIENRLQIKENLFAQMKHT